MNAGQYLLALSPLSSGTAGQHLLAIRIGTGQTIFCSQRTVVLGQEETFVTRRPKREATQEAPFVQPPPANDERKQNFYATCRGRGSYILREGPDEITAIRRTVNCVVTSREARTEVTKARKTT